MFGNIIGERLLAMNFGESHGRCVGTVVDGCPAGLPFEESFVQKKLDLRKPGQSVVTTQRKEEDRVEILSGVFEGHTNGGPICMIIWNRDQDSRPYDQIKDIPRPGHSDYPAMIKYGRYADYRGGGRFSGRLTATFVMAGAVAERLLKETLGTDILAYSVAIGQVRAPPIDFNDALKHRYANEVRCPDAATAKRMKEAILEAKRSGDSLGGIIECVTSRLPVGLGEPLFGSLESDLSRALFGIPSVKAVEFGSGFHGCSTHGSENNDVYRKDGEAVVTVSNNSGGILGGLSTGMPLVMRIGFKPPSSIAQSQETLDLSKGSQVKLKVPGRHDPCVVPRAPPVVEAIVSLILADHAIRYGLIPSSHLGMKDGF